DPSASIWINLLGGDWHNPANWNTQVVPNGSSSDSSLPSAAITNFGFYTITNDLSVFINEFFYNNPAGTLAGIGNMDLRGPFIWEGGSFTGPGVIVARGGIQIDSAANAASKRLSAKT